MNFEKRDVVLLFAVLFLMIGLLPFIAPIYALIIAALVFFGLKVFVSKRKRTILEKIGEGLCANCGEKIINKKCPNCDKT